MINAARKCDTAAVGVAVATDADPLLDRRSGAAVTHFFGVSFQERNLIAECWADAAAAAACRALQTRFGP